MVEGDLGPLCLCIGLVACSAAQTTFWPSCSIFSDTVLPDKPEDSQKLRDPSLPPLSPLKSTAEMGGSVVLRVPEARRTPWFVTHSCAKLTIETAFVTFQLGRI